MLGGLVTPNPSGISMGHPECPSQGLVPGASPELGRVMGALSCHPSAAELGALVGGVSRGRGQANSHKSPGCALLLLGKLCRERSLAPAQISRYQEQLG